MSDFTMETPADGGVFEGEASVSDTTADLFGDTVVDGGEVQPTEGTISEPLALSVDEFGDHLVTVKVGGQDIQVPLKDALSGHMRQADYTRKTQELAELRSKLSWGHQVEEAFTADPAAALQTLAEVFGLSDYLSVDQLDPRDRELASLRARQSAQAQQDSSARVQAEMDAVAKQYEGIEFDPLALLDHAATTNAPSLKVAFTDLYSDQIIDHRLAQREAAAAKTAKTVDAKRAAGVVAGGAGGSRTVVADAPSKPLSLRESFLLARKQHPN